MKKLIVSGVLALLAVAVVGCTCSRDKSEGSEASLGGACEQNDQGVQSSCEERKVQMEKRRPIKIDSRRFMLNKNLISGAIRKQVQDTGKLPTDQQKKEVPTSAEQKPAAPAPVVKQNPTPAVKLTVKPTVKLMPVMAPAPTKK